MIQLLFYVILNHIILDFDCLTFKFLLLNIQYRVVLNVFRSQIILEANSYLFPFPKEAINTRGKMSEKRENVGYNTLKRDLLSEENFNTLKLAEVISH